MSDVQIPPFQNLGQPEGPNQRPGWRRKRVLVPGLLVALIAFGSLGGDDKESPEALLSVTQAADSDVKKVSEQAARDLAAAEAAAEQAAEDRAAAEAAAKAAADTKAAAEAAARAEQQKAAADKVAADKVAADKAAADKAAADKAAADKAAAERAAAEQAAAAAQQQKAQTQLPAPAGNCTPEYPDFCIPLRAGDAYNCPDFSQKNFRALAPDPYRLDGNDKDGIACESR
jgi:hypothetical protein